MSVINFSEIENASSSNSNAQVSFFSLKNGQEAVVRFMVDSVDDFELLQVHQISVGGKYRTINCLREVNDPADKCPLCGIGTPVKKLFYIPMLRYTTDAQGAVTVTPCVWCDRSMAMARQLKGYIDNYGPLSDILCKVTRTGEGLSTSWNIIPNLNPSIYRPDIYAKREDLLANYHALGRVVLNKNFEDIQVFLATGQFPQTSNQTDAAPAQDVAYQPQVAVSQPQQGFVYENTAGVGNPFMQNTTAANPGIARPVRNFN